MGVPRAAYLSLIRLRKTVYNHRRSTGHNRQLLSPDWVRKATLLYVGSAQVILLYKAQEWLSFSMKLYTAVASCHGEVSALRSAILDEVCTLCSQLWTFERSRLCHSMQQARAPVHTQLWWPSSPSNGGVDELQKKKTYEKRSSLTLKYILAASDNASAKQQIGFWSLDPIWRIWRIQCLRSHVVQYYYNYKGR